jgi:hypothetical protein
MKFPFSSRAYLHRLVLLAWMISLPATSLWGQQADKTTQPKTAIQSKQKTDLAEVPYDEIVAIVLGKGIYASDVALAENVVEQYSTTLSKQEFEKRLAGMRAKQFELLIYLPILQAFVKKHGLSPTQKEINLLAEEFARRHPTAGAADDKFLRQFDERIVLSWKTSKFMFEKHGGRVGLSKFGPSVSFSGRLALLKEQKKLGNFAFRDEADEKLFWKRINDESGWDAVIEGDEATEFFQTTPWATAKTVNDRHLGKGERLNSK